MRTPNLQYLYLQKPVTLTVIICLISILPWIFTGEFSTKGEPREAAVAISMLETGNWILPQTYADAFAYKPPMLHWLIALFSLPQGYVSEFTARLPSALSFTVMIAFILVFFGKRLRFQQAFVATLILITCIEMHRAAMTSRVDMLLTSFMVIGMLQLYRWEDQLELKGLPLGIPLLLGCAVLTKGPIGIILPLFVFGVYLLILRKYSFLTIFKAVIYAGIASLFLPLLWYISAYKEAGDRFLNVVLAENFGRFFRVSIPDVAYDLGHKNGAWYNLVTLIAGFMPWTLLYFFSLFSLKWCRPHKSIKQLVYDSWQRIISMDKEKLFSLVALICIVFFYSIPSSKRSVYLMPAYPFIAIFLAQYTLYITEYKKRTIRFFGGLLLTVTLLVLVFMCLTATGCIDPVNLAGHFTQRAKTLESVYMATRMFNPLNTVTVCIMLLLAGVSGILIYQLFKKVNIKILYTTIALIFCINLLIDGVFMRGIRKSGSTKAFAAWVLDNYPVEKQNTYVMNDITQYSNMYGLNFYLRNKFQNFEKALPMDGFFFCAQKDWDKIRDKYGDRYEFAPITTTNNTMGEINDKIIFSTFSQKSANPSEK